jgi:hypothetical protein
MRRRRSQWCSEQQRWLVLLHLARCCWLGLQMLQLWLAELLACRTAVCLWLV